MNICIPLLGDIKTNAALDYSQIKHEEVPDDEAQLELLKIKEPKKLLAASKKIPRKRIIGRHNANKFIKFFKKWKDLKKSDESVKQETKFWFSSFDRKLNKTYIYREFFDSVRIHFRLTTNSKSFKLDKLNDTEWAQLFINLTDFLRIEVFDKESEIDREKKSIVVPVWIEGIDSFRVEWLL
mmetsp:Transcript_38277/g.44605  ORF Transcript_38277/g.44605 Transcript_38277/m.44605 type:complete len:182 (+) Transcript_38277:40-585(+)